jgi:outer membrane receptor protein involved in Fe transport
VYKTYGELNYELTDDSKLHVEALYSYLDMPEWKSSPAYPPNSLFGADRVIPATHPGLIQFKQDYPEMFATLPAGTTIDTVEAYMRSRMLGVNGRNGEPLSAYIEAETYRFGASLTGNATENVGYTLGATFSRREREANGYDMQIQGMAFALNGLGGEGCTPGGANPATSTPGVGPCEWFNPFSQAIERSAVTGPNPTFVPAVANSKELINWLTLEGTGNTINELLVFDLVFDGEFEFMTLPGGAIGWALGAQTRNESYETELSPVSNRADSPCPWTDPFAVTLGFTTADQLSPNCNPKTGRVGFGVPGDEADESRTVYAVFSELALPITDTLDVQAAVRFEDYGSDGGSTIDPKFAVKWQAFDWLAFRASASSTFRGPSLSYLSGVNTYLQNIAAANAYRAVNVIGNDDLDPESALATSAGIILQAGGFTATVDYWKFDFQDPFQIESAAQILGAYGGNGCFDGGAGAPVGGPISPICQQLRPRIEPTGAVSADLAAVNTYFINGTDIDTDGVDFMAQYAFDMIGGQITVGFEGTYTNKYESEDFESLEGIVLAPGGDFAGEMNIGLNPFYPLPDLKGNAFVRYGNDNWQLGYTMRYVTEYDDETPGLGFFHPYLVEIEEMTTHDVTAVYTWNEFIVSASVYNLTDEDPPYAFAAQEYDPYTHNPLGRIVKLQLTYTFRGN